MRLVNHGVISGCLFGWQFPCSLSQLLRLFLCGQNLRRKWSGRMDVDCFETRLCCFQECAPSRWLTGGHSRPVAPRGTRDLVTSTEFPKAAIRQPKLFRKFLYRNRPNQVVQFASRDHLCRLHLPLSYSSLPELNDRAAASRLRRMTY